MLPLRPKPALALVTTLVALAGCGGGEGEPADESGMPAAEARPLTREPLTEADLSGLERENLWLELPWTENRANRDPTPRAARSGVLEAEPSGHDGFDRVLFRFTDSAPFPGYRVRIVEAGASVPCGEEETTLELDGERALVVHLAPARANADGTVWLPVGTRALSQTRFLEGGVVCDAGSDVVWAAGLSEGSQIRVLELREPQRLAVDVR